MNLMENYNPSKNNTNEISSIFERHFDTKMTLRKQKINKEIKLFNEKVCNKMQSQFTYEKFLIETDLIEIPNELRLLRDGVELLFDNYNVGAVYEYFISENNNNELILYGLILTKHYLNYLNHYSKSGNILFLIEFNEGEFIERLFFLLSDTKEISNNACIIISEIVRLLYNLNIKEHNDTNLLYWLDNCLSKEKIYIHWNKYYVYVKTVIDEIYFTKSKSLIIENFLTLTFNLMNLDTIKNMFLRFFDTCLYENLFKLIEDSKHNESAYELICKLLESNLSNNIVKDLIKFKNVTLKTLKLETEEDSKKWNLNLIKIKVNILFLASSFIYTNQTINEQNLYFSREDTSFFISLSQSVLILLKSRQDDFEFNNNLIKISLTLFKIFSNISMGNKQDNEVNLLI